MNFNNKRLEMARLFSRRKLLKGLAGGTTGAILAGPLGTMAGQWPGWGLETARAQNLDDHALAQQAEWDYRKHSPLGGWQVTVTYLTIDRPPEPGLQMYAAGGGYAESNGLRIQTGIGSWQSTGPNSFAYHFIGQYFDENGALTRYNDVLHPAATLSDDGLSYESDGAATVYNPDGTVLRTAKVHLKGSRIVVP